MSRIFWDTNLFIYLFEGQGALLRQVSSLRQAMLVRGDQLVTSAFTLGEILVKPKELGQEELSRKYVEVITTTSLVLPFDAKCAPIYANIRSDRSVRPPDAIQLACAANSASIYSSLMI